MTCSALTNWTAISRKQRQLKEYLMPRRPNTPHAPREYQWAKEPIGSIVRDPLYEALLMRVRYNWSPPLFSP